MAIDGKKIKGGGITTRQATLEVRAALANRNINPIDYLAAHLETADPNISEKDRIKIAMELAKYTAPQLKSVDIGSSDEEGLVIRVKRFSEKAVEKLPEMFTEEGNDLLKGLPPSE